jgi:hypothetical protein
MGMGCGMLGGTLIALYKPNDQNKITPVQDKPKPIEKNKELTWK